MNEHAEFSLLDEYVLGTLGIASAERVKEHLATCAACRAECDELRGVIDVLPHALPAAKASAELRDRIFAALDAPASAPAVAPAPAPRESPAARLRPSYGLVAGLAAALLLALAGDAFFATRAASPMKVAIVAPSAARSAAPTPHPGPSPRIVPPTSSPRRTAEPATPRTPVLPTAVPPTPDGRRPTADGARLERQLHAAQAATAAQITRIRQLESALATARTTPRVVTVVVTPPPTPLPTGAPPTPAPSDDAELVAALRTGKVYTIDGAVGSEPWHLTIVQPRDGAHALLYSGTPDAPSGETYRSWVVRSGQTVSLGELPPGKPATLEMPMALQVGDVVAFSLEPAGSGDVPTTKFLMELTIRQ